MHSLCKSTVDNGDVTSGVDQGSHRLPFNLNVDVGLDSLSQAINDSICYCPVGFGCVSLFFVLLDPVAELQYVSWAPAAPARTSRGPCSMLIQQSVA